ncbi:MmgE/PrpD family protein [Amycolatopsis sp. DSM 110486]|uniref:MmgE/PrpD family protein n=1 Tax=Amycolatopsis sp. DSM 110486 TaxID=2865832 RepID=UPI001C6A87EA|nr:MmgE/PrpD family protein [Amycolatopsis sp. DSM 110486]QYN21608.1 MmgE/PrpD family protein [Amycolatopsis sp. DSM 110486]
MPFVTTQVFCANVRKAADAPLPETVSRAARRSLFNVLGTAIGAARTPAVEALLATAEELGAAGAVPVPGRAELLDPEWAATVVGTAAHLDDFDDTHLATVIHPGAAVLAAVLALAPETAPDGATALEAFALGCEAQLRIGVAISPSHYDYGWHITGTCGVFGAAVAAAHLLGLDADQLGHALGIASTGTLGQREAFGSMTKPLHPGKAAAVGVFAARLAAAGLTAPEDPLGPGGVLPVFSEPDYDELRRDWAGTWELEYNAFKPYPCGIVAHPAIDAAIGASAAVGDPGAITAVRISCHPLVPELMGRLQPADGLQARFSARHAAAVGLLDGEVGLRQFSDERAIDEDVTRLRALTELVPTPDCPRDSATIRVERAGAEPVEVHIEHARGSMARPLTDEELFTKVDRLVEPVLGAGAARKIEAAVDGLPGAPGIDAVIEVMRPEVAK